MANVSSGCGEYEQPKLRFPGFDGAWKETTLSAIFSKNTQKNSDRQITNVICNSAKLGLIPQREYFDKDIANSDNTGGYYIIRQNDFVYNPRKSADAPYGPIRCYKYAEDGIVSPLYLCFRAKDKINPSFYDWYFHSSVWHKYIYMSGDSGARHDRVSIKDDIFFAMPLNIPSPKEQEVIVEFLEKVNARIEKQQALVEALTKFKRGLLNKLFPRNGAKVPELRFAGFTGDWEQRKLGEIAWITSGFMGNSLLSSGQYRLTRIETIADGVVDETRVGYSDIKPDDSYLLKEGDILYSNINSISHMGKVAKYQGKSTLYHGINLLRIIPKATVDSDFLEQTLNSESKRNWAKSHANQAVSQASINQSLLASQEILICSLSEQKLIGCFLTTLDNLITLHQHKCETLQKYKDGLMQQLFI